MSRYNDCPYGAGECPKVAELEGKVRIIEKNQLKIMRTVYYIAGIVSVSLGVTVMI